MARDPRRSAALMFVLVGVLSYVAALLPLAKGEPMNVAFLGVGVVFTILGAVRLRKSPEDRKPPTRDGESI